MVKVVQDLTREELDELKTAFFWQDETQDILEGAYSQPWEIPDEIIFEHYDGMTFMDDDFFCNLKES